MLNTATSFKIRGIAPADLAGQPDNVKKMYWQWVVEFGLKRKDQELSKGLDKDGKPLRRLDAQTRKYRRSAMTPSGKGDPAAPPLMPAYHLSRTRSLLAGRALTTHADFFWRFDPFTGDSWGVVLVYQKLNYGRDVFGLSPAGTAWVQRQALQRWLAWKAHRHPAHPEAKPVKHPPRALPLPRAGRPTSPQATFGIGATGPEKFAIGRWSGAMTWEERRRHITQPARATIPGRPSRKKTWYNRLLKMIWSG